MKVKDLIKQLKKMPKDAIVMQLWDGEPRTEINVVYLSKKGEVITSDFNEKCWSEESQPIDKII